MTVDVLIDGAELVATLDPDDRELPGGWVALGGCTTTTDHLYVHPRHGGDLISAEITAARELGMRFHPTRGSMILSEKDGGWSGSRWRPAPRSPSPPT